MKRVSKYYLFVICFIIALFLFSGAVFASSVLSSSSFKYTPASGSTITSNNIKGTLDELYTKVNRVSESAVKDNNVMFDYLNSYSPHKNISSSDYKAIGHRVFRAVNGSQESLCLYAYNVLNCFDTNNYVIEVEHLKRMFKDTTVYTATQLGGWGNPTPDEPLDYTHDTCIICPDSVCDVEYINCRKVNDAGDYTDYDISIRKNGSISIVDEKDEDVVCYLGGGENFNCDDAP